MRNQIHRQLRNQKIQQRRPAPVSKPVPIPAPYSGLNTRDSLDSMAPTDAVTMENFFPTEGEVKVRPGSTEIFDTGTETNVDFIFEHYIGVSRTCIVATNNSLYDVTTMTTVDSVTDGATTADHLIDSTKAFTTGPLATTDSIVINDTDGTYSTVTAVADFDLTLGSDIMSTGEDYRITEPLATGLNSDTWDGLAFDGSLVLVNDSISDDIYSWDGTTLTNNTANYTGVSDAKLWSGVAEYKERLFFWTGRDQDFWYMDAAKAVTGAAVQFSLSRVNQFGGVLVDIQSWTVDGGDGIDDFMVCLMSSGEVIVYQGTDPGDANRWYMTGIFKIAEPMGGVRSMAKVGGDLMLVCKDDIIPMSIIFQKGYTGTNTKISGAIRQQSVNYSTAYGWSITLHPTGNMLIINYPDASKTEAATVYNQYTMNTVTGAWCKFTGLNARCWGVYNSLMSFGGTDGKVYKLSGTTDAATAIEAEGISAWTDLGTPYEKHPTLCKPIVSGTGSFDYAYKVGYDFTTPVADSSTTVSSDGTAWGSPWGSPWSPPVNIKTGWKLTSGKGQFLSIAIKISARQEMSWLRTDLRGDVTSNL